MTNRQQIVLTKDRRQKTERLTTNTRLKADEQIESIGEYTSEDNERQTSRRKTTSEKQTEDGRPSTDRYIDNRQT